MGINAAILSPEGADNGVGFAIPPNLARNIMKHWWTPGKVTRGYLGVVMHRSHRNWLRRWSCNTERAR